MVVAKAPIASLIHRSAWKEDSANFALKLSEKGYEQHFERGIGRRKKAKMGRKAPLRCSVMLHRRLLRPFSDSLFTGF
jgi:hypothetical protein